MNGPRKPDDETPPASIPSLRLNMNALIESKMTELRALCEKYHVARLELFGSATTDEWDSQRSDLDFLVTFATPPVGMLGFDQYMELWFGLQDLFDRKIDLVEESAMTNPYFIASVNRYRVPVYVERAA